MTVLFVPDGQQSDNQPYSKLTETLELYRCANEGWDRVFEHEKIRVHSISVFSCLSYRHWQQASRKDAGEHLYVVRVRHRTKHLIIDCLVVPWETQSSCYSHNDTPFSNEWA